MTTIRGCMQNFSLLSQFLGQNAASTKFGVTKYRIAHPAFDHRNIIWLYQDVFSHYPIFKIYSLGGAHLFFNCEHFIFCAHCKTKTNKKVRVFHNICLCIYKILQKSKTFIFNPFPLFSKIYDL